MSKEMREQINKVKNWEQFLNENKDTWYDIDDKLSILKSYIHILKNSKEDYDLAISYFIILHNFLIVERGFFEDVKLHNKEINKYLKLEKLNNEKDVYNKFLELYDTNNIVRNNIETIDNIDSVGEYLSKRPELYRELLKK
jgi:hypothetical protein